MGGRDGDEGLDQAMEQGRASCEYKIAGLVTVGLLQFRLWVDNWTAVRVHLSARVEITCTELL